MAQDTSQTASELRLVLGQLVRRLRAEHRFPISQGTVLGRLDREGPQSVSDLAAKELAEDRRHREGWLAGALDERLTARERRVVEEAVELLRRLADA